MRKMHSLPAMLMLGPKLLALPLELDPLGRMSIKPGYELHQLLQRIDTLPVLLLKLLQLELHRVVLLLILPQTHLDMLGSALQLTDIILGLTGLSDERDAFCGVIIERRSRPAPAGSSSSALMHTPILMDAWSCQCAFHIGTHAATRGLCVGRDAISDVTTDLLSHPDHAGSSSCLPRRTLLQKKVLLQR